VFVLTDIITFQLTCHTISEGLTHYITVNIYVCHDCLTVTQDMAGGE